MGLGESKVRGSTGNTTYILAVQAPARLIGTGAFATESAFAEHLIQLRRALPTSITRLVLLAPELDESRFDDHKHHFTVLTQGNDGISFVPLCPANVTAIRYWVHHSWRIWLLMRRLLRVKAIVHSQIATDLRRPSLLFVNMAAWYWKRPTVFVVDIDFTRYAEMARSVGLIGSAKYRFYRYVTDPFRSIQLRLAPHMYQLVLLKSAALVRDFGCGLSHVKNFYDTVHRPEHLLTPDELANRLRWIATSAETFRVCYFGRLVPYKGVDRMIEAVRLAASDGVPICLDIIGDGPSAPNLRRQIQAAGLEARVKMIPGVPYGPELFSLLRDVHVTIAAPLVEDTPRAAFDSFARAIPIVAFDNSYFSDLAESSGAVLLAKWPSAYSLAIALGVLAGRRAQLAEMAANARAFAAIHTQEIWLRRRVEWTREFGLAR